MDILKSNPKNGKVLFFSDLHLGIHQNSSAWHSNSLKVAEFVKNTMKSHKLDTIIFAGDVFHDRHEIGVNTLHVAKRFFDCLSDFKIHIIPGNHDAFLSTTSEINSVEILANQNIKIYNKIEIVEMNGKRILFCPWKADLQKYFEDAEVKKVDIIVGHFEIVNFKMNPTKICDHGNKTSDFFEYTDAVITGHFHYRDHRKYEDKYVLYLGSPYEMDFSDRGQQKGVSIVDLEDLSVSFVENTTTPKHHRLQLTDLLHNDRSDLAQTVKGNIVSLYVDVDVDALTVDLLSTKLSQLEPFQLRTEFNILDKAQTHVKEIEKLSIDIETAFVEFVEHVDTRATKKDVLNKCLELYKSCQASYE